MQLFSRKFPGKYPWQSSITVKLHSLSLQFYCNRTLTQAFSCELAFFQNTSEQLLSESSRWEYLKSNCCKNYFNLSWDDHLDLHALQWASHVFKTNKTCSWKYWVKSYNAILKPAYKFRPWFLLRRLFNQANSNNK